MHQGGRRVSHVQFSFGQGLGIPTCLRMSAVQETSVSQYGD